MGLWVLLSLTVVLDLLAATTAVFLLLTSSINNNAL